MLLIGFHKILMIFYDFIGFHEVLVTFETCLSISFQKGVGKKVNESTSLVST